MISNLTLNSLVTFDYVNYNGIDSKRVVWFRGMQFGTIPEYYTEPTLLMVGLDTKKEAYRSFDVTKMRNIEVS